MTMGTSPNEYGRLKRTICGTILGRRQNIHAFINMQDADEIVTADRIIGCPHEEGIDYPLGRACPQVHSGRR